MKKYIPFDLFVPEKYMTEDLSIGLLPVETTCDNPYSSKGDILVAVFFSEETDILSHLMDNSFILLKNVENAPTPLTSMRLKITNNIYTFYPLSKIATQPIVKFQENLSELEIVGKVLFGFHDFANLTDINERFREILRFDETGVDFP